MKHVLLLAIATVTLLTVGCGKTSDHSESELQVSRPPSELGRTVTEKQLIESLSSKDLGSSIRVLNEVKASKYSDHLAPLLSRMWKGERPGGIDGDFLASPRIRIELADCLAQMERNGVTGLERTAYADYARQMIQSNDPDVARQAILVLGIAGSTRDVSVMERILIEGETGRFRAAAIALTDMCSINGSEIQRVAAKLTEQDRRDYLLQTWEKMKAFRPCRER